MQATPQARIAAAPAAVVQAAGTFVSLPSVRLLDTRKNSGGSTPAAGGTVRLIVRGRGGVPTNASAVVLNVTAVAPTGAGYVTVYADGAAKPTASSLNFPKGAIVPNSVVAPIGSDGKVALYNGGSGKTPLLADVSGYFVSGTPSVAGAFKSLAPSRLLDTRKGSGGSTPGGKGSVNLQVTGKGGVPTSGVSAVVLNVTVAGPSAGGYVTVYGAGKARPSSSNLNFVKGQTIANLVVAPVGTAGKVTLYNGAPGSTPLVADVAGYFRSGTVTAPGAFKVLTPTRAMDTRNDLGSSTLGPEETANLAIDGSEDENDTGVPPTDVSAVVLNVTATNTEANGYVTVYSDADEQPATSNLNFVKGQTVPNLTFAKVDNYQYLDFYNGSPGSIDLLADIAGYFVGTDGSVSGSVVDSGDGTALENVEVDLIHDDTGNFENYAYTDSDGTFQVDDLPAGDYDVCFYGGDVTSPVETGYQSGCLVDTVTVQAQQNTPDIDVALDPGGAITGTITLDGASADDDIVYNGVDVYDADQNYVGFGEVDTDGSYRAGGLPEGDLTVCFDSAYDYTTDTSYAGECYVDQPYDEYSGEVPSGTTPVSVTVGNFSSGIDATLDADPS